MGRARGIDRVADVLSELADDMDPERLVEASREDRRRIYGEARYITIGYLDERMVILAGTRRRRSRHVIRMRKANGREQARYAPDIRR